MTAFFILSSARSGSTSLARILDAATNGSCAIEPSPDLNVESRLAMDGRLDDPERVVREVVVPRVEKGCARDGIYGEKHVTYGPFVARIHGLTGGRFVFLRRDGRDVVRSMIDWHERMFGNVYREAPEPGDLSPRAISAAAHLLVHHDTSDYARPRPQPGSRWYDRWETMSRLEMCAFYWATVNDRYRRQLAGLPADAWIEIDYTRPEADDVQRVADFLGLQGLDRDRIASMLESRINSLAERGAEAGSFPRWMDWHGGHRRAFDEIAGDTMRRLGYGADAATRWRPAGYGACWDAHAADVAWYEWMHDSRRRMHEEAVDWIRQFDATDAPITSVADFGCGLGVGYCDALADRRYAGFDLVPSTIEWCRAHRDNEKHSYEHLDFIAERPRERYDVVMSSGTIDNGYDVEAFLDAMIHASRRWIYLTCYRGWFPDYAEHRYQWSDDDRCYYTDISPRRIQEHLRARGCEDVRVEPRATGRADIPLETRIIARVPETVARLENGTVTSSSSTPARAEEQPA
jgi:hypothetical protein